MAWITYNLSTVQGATIEPTSFTPAELQCLLDQLCLRKAIVVEPSTAEFAADIFGALGGTRASPCCAALSWRRSRSAARFWARALAGPPFLGARPLSCREHYILLDVV